MGLKCWNILECAVDKNVIIKDLKRQTQTAIHSTLNFIRGGKREKT